MGEDQEHKQRIKVWMAFAMVITALSIDGFNALLNLVVIGEILSSIISPVATFGFIIWFWLQGVTFIKSPKKLAAMGGQALIGLIPIINTLPELTLGVLVTIILTRSEDKGGLLSKATGMASPLTGRRGVVGYGRQFTGNAENLRQRFGNMRLTPKTIGNLRSGGYGRHGGFRKFGDRSSSGYGRPDGFVKTGDSPSTRFGRPEGLAPKTIGGFGASGYSRPEGTASQNQSVPEKVISGVASSIPSQSENILDLSGANVGAPIVTTAPPASVPMPDTSREESPELEISPPSPIISDVESLDSRPGIQVEPQIPMKEISASVPETPIAQSFDTAPSPTQDLNAYLERDVFSKIGLTKEDEERALTEVPEDKRIFLQRSFENTRESTKAFFEVYSEQGIINQKQRKVDEEQPEGVSDTKDYKVKISREDLLETLTSEANKTKDNNTVTLNMNWKGLMLMLRDGKLKTFKDLPPEQQAALGRNYVNYSERRDQLEADLGFTNGESVAYGCYANTDGIEAKQGGAGTYGDFFIEIEPPENTSYTEGDSFNGNDTLAGAEKRKITKSEYTQVEGRHIQREQVHIAKAIYNLEKGFNEQYESGGLASYIEAQIPNFDLNMIKRINVPDENAKENILRNLGKIQNGEIWREKINVIN